MKYGASVRVLLVCMGNICRSPMAEGVLVRCLREAGLGGRVGVDSAGTHAYHVGEPPDPRARAAARRRGVEIDDLRARQVAREDFERFDHILAMDRDNFDLLAGLCPDAHRHKLRLFMEFAPAAPRREVPDPYYGGERGFDDVLDLLEAAAEGLVRELRGAVSGAAGRSGV